MKFQHQPFTAQTKQNSTKMDNVVQLNNNPQPRDQQNNEISSTSQPRIIRYRNKYFESSSDNEIEPKMNLVKKPYHRSTGNLNEGGSSEVRTVKVTNGVSTDVKKYEELQIPIVGYEVMEERARFTIYKLKVEDDKRDQSWLVFRRYTDFVRLYTRLKNELPNVQMPLPGKRWFRDNFEPAFLEDRVRGLQVFINALLQKLPSHPTVREFFCLDDPPQPYNYQPEVQAIYGALEETITNLKIQSRQKDATISHLQKRIDTLERQMRCCDHCKHFANN